MPRLHDVLNINMFNRIVSYNNKAFNHLLDVFEGFPEIVYKFHQYKIADGNRDFSGGTIIRDEIFNFAYCVDGHYTRIDSDQDPELSELVNKHYNLDQEELCKLEPLPVSIVEGRASYGTSSKTNEKIFKYIKDRVLEKDPYWTEEKVCNLFMNIYYPGTIYPDALFVRDFLEIPEDYSVDCPKSLFVEDFPNYSLDLKKLSDMEKIIEVAKKFIDEYGGVISGSAALAIYNYQNDLPNKFIPNDIDVFTTDEEMFRYCCMKYVENRKINRYSDRVNWARATFSFEDVCINLIFISEKPVDKTTEYGWIYYNFLYIHDTVLFRNIQISEFEYFNPEEIQYEEILYFFENMKEGDMIKFLLHVPFCPGSWEKILKQFKTLDIEKLTSLVMSGERYFYFFWSRFEVLLKTNSCLPLIEDEKTMQKEHSEGHCRYIPWISSPINQLIQNIKILYLLYSTYEKCLKLSEEFEKNKPTPKLPDMNLLHKHIDVFDMTFCRLIWTPTDGFDLTHNNHSFISANYATCLLRFDKITSLERIKKYSSRGFKVVIFGNQNETISSSNKFGRLQMFGIF